MCSLLGFSCIYFLFCGNISIFYFKENHHNLSLKNIPDEEQDPLMEESKEGQKEKNEQIKNHEITFSTD
jgi:hypothetical protein